MSLIRGIRSMVREYSREDKDQTEPNENIVSSIVLETSDDDDFYVKIANAWPESIILSAPIIILNSSFGYNFSISLTKSIV